MTLGIHCWCLAKSLLYHMYPGYTLLWWHCVYIAGAFLYHYYSLCTLDTNCCDDPGYTLLALNYITIPYIPWIHIVIMTLGIHFWCLSISLLYLMYPGYTLLWWPRVYIAGAYQYHYYTLWSLDTHCYDDPRYTFLVLIYITIIAYVPWIHIVMMTLGIHCWCFSISLYLMVPRYTCYDDQGYTLLVLINIPIIPYGPSIHIVMMTLGIHFWCLSISLL